MKVECVNIVNTLEEKFSVKFEESILMKTETSIRNALAEREISLLQNAFLSIVRLPMMMNV